MRGMGAGGRRPSEAVDLGLRRAIASKAPAVIVVVQNSSAAAMPFLRARRGVLSEPRFPGCVAVVLVIRVQAHGSHLRPALLVGCCDASRKAQLLTNRPDGHRQGGGGSSSKTL